MSSTAAELSEWIALLERENELVRIVAEVAPDLEITEITVGNKLWSFRRR